MEPMFELSDTQAQLQHSLARWLDQTAPFERRAALLANPAAITPLWNGLGQQLGLLGAALPEGLGGLGGSLADQAVILQALGHALLPEPYCACAVVGAGLLQRLPGDTSRRLLAGVVDGSVRPVLAALEPGARHDLAQVQARLSDLARPASSASPASPTEGPLLSGRKAVVRAAPYATHWLVSARDAAGLLRLALVDPGAAGVSRRDLRLADGSWGAELAFDHTPVSALLGDPAQDALPLITQAVDDGQLATGAEAIGVMQRLMHDTLAYVRQRQQFGVAIASFQVIGHRLADMHMALLQANALVGATLVQWAGAPSAAPLAAPFAAPSAAAQRIPSEACALQRTRAVASAQVAVARAARAVGQGAVQLHGGMGMTDELVVGHAFKRLTLIEHLMGGVDVHLRRVARSSAAVA